MPISKGPWKIVPEDTPVVTKTNFLNVLCVVNADNRTVAQITDLTHDQASAEQRANAEAISALPDTIAELEQIKQQRDELIKAAKSALEVLRAFGEFDDGCFYYRQRSASEMEAPYHLLRAALTKAGVQI